MNIYKDLYVSDPLPGFGWVAVDFDGTLAISIAASIMGDEKPLGEPVMAMVRLVIQWLCEGQKVCLFTARIAPHADNRDLMRIHKALQEWCLKHIGQVIPITCIKEPGIRTIVDDRAIHVEKNTGKIV